MRKLRASCRYGFALLPFLVSLSFAGSPDWDGRDGSKLKDLMSAVSDWAHSGTTSPWTRYYAGSNPSDLYFPRSWGIDGRPNVRPAKACDLSGGTDSQLEACDPFKDVAVDLRVLPRECAVAGTGTDAPVGGCSSTKYK